MECIVSPATQEQQEIYAHLDKLVKAQIGLECGFTHLGMLLASFKARETWRPLGFVSFDTFLGDLYTRYRLRKSQLYSYLTVAEQLLPHYDATTLDEIGISKALEIKRALKHNKGKALPDTIIEAARNTETTTRELRVLIGETLNLPDDREAGAWFDFGGSYLTPDERAEYVSAVNVAILALGIKPHVPEHIQRKEVLLAFAREFFSTHAPDVYGPSSAPVAEPVLILPPMPTPEGPS